MMSDLYSPTWTSPYTGYDPVSWFQALWDDSFALTWGPAPIMDYLGLMFPNQIQYGMIFKFQSEIVQALTQEQRDLIDYG